MCKYNLIYSIHDTKKMKSMKYRQEIYFEIKKL